MLGGAGLWPLNSFGMGTSARADDDQAVGHGGIFDFLRDSDPPISGMPEMGWILAPEAQGRGYAEKPVKPCSSGLPSNSARKTSGR